jgi:hypothetical protein
MLMKQSQNKLIGSRELRSTFAQSPTESMATRSRQHGCHFTASSQAAAPRAARIHGPRQSLQLLKQATTKLRGAPDQIKDIEEPTGRHVLARKSWQPKLEKGPRFQSPMGIIGVQKVKPIGRNRSQLHGAYIPEQMASWNSGERNQEKF